MHGPKQTSSRHAAIREFGTTNYIRQAKLIEKHLTPKTAPDVAIGDTVGIKIDRVDQSGTDKKILACKVTKQRSHKQWEVACAYGTLESTYGANALIPLGTANFAELEAPLSQEKISLRTAAIRSSNAQLQNAICSCKGDCQTLRCCCKRAGVGCGTQCHPKGGDCKNNDDDIDSDNNEGKVYENSNTEENNKDAFITTCSDTLKSSTRLTVITKHSQRKVLKSKNTQVSSSNTTLLDYWVSNTKVQHSEFEPLVDLKDHLSDGAPKSLPWGLTALINNINPVQLQNTCALDTILTITYHMLNAFPEIMNAARLLSAEQRLPAALLSMYKAFSQEYYADAKIEWLLEHPQYKSKLFGSNNKTVNMWTSITEVFYDIWVNDIEQSDLMVAKSTMTLLCDIPEYCPEPVNMKDEYWVQLVM